MPACVSHSTKSPIYIISSCQRDSSTSKKAFFFLRGRNLAQTSSHLYKLLFFTGYILCLGDGARYANDTKAKLVIVRHLVTALWESAESESKKKRSRSCFRREADMEIKAHQDSQHPSHLAYNSAIDPSCIAEPGLAQRRACSSRELRAMRGER